MLSDQVILGIVGAFGSAFAVYMSYKMAQLAKVAKETHKAVNSLSLILARRLSAVSTRLADITGDERDIVAAEDAKKALRQSEEVQEKLDQGK